MTVAVTHSALRRPAAAQERAITPISWSPSTTWPRSSTTITRSASPSRAMPRWAPALAHQGLQPLGMHGAAFAVDVGAVGLDPDRDHLGAQLPEHGRRHLVGGAIGAIDHDLQPARLRPFGKLDFTNSM